MSIWDIVILIILLAGAYRGYQKGLLREVVALIALVAGVIGAIQFMPVGMNFLSTTFEVSSEFLPVLAFFLIFIVIVILLSLAGRLLKLVIDLTPLGFVDGIGGALLGMLKWALGISIILWVLDMGKVDLPVSSDSLIYENVRQVAPYVFEHIGEWVPLFKDLIDTIKKLFSEVNL